MGCYTHQAIPVFVGQALTILSLFQLLHFFVKRIGQPRVVSEILTGVLIGTILSRVEPFEGEFAGSSRDVLGSVATVGRNIYMFLIGLELDPAFLWQTCKMSSLIMITTTGISAAISFTFVPWVMDTLGTKVGYYRFVFLFTIIIAGTSAPTAVRAAAELKLAMIDIGRLAIVTSIITDMVMLLLAGVKIPGSPELFTDIFLDGYFICMSFASAMCIYRPILRWLDRRNQGREISNFQFGVLVMVLLFLSASDRGEQIFFAFFIGLAFPKTGNLARSVVRRMRLPVNKLLLPLVFAYGSMKADVRDMHGRDVVLVAATVLLSLIGKISGTTCICRMLGIPWAQTIVMGLLLNVKGQVDLIILGRAVTSEKTEQEVLLVAIFSAIINTIITPPLVMAIVKFDRRDIVGYKAVGLELLPPESELRMLAAAHMSASLPPILTLVEGSRGPFAAPTSVYFMQLIQLTDANAAMLLQDQRDNASNLRVKPGGLDPADSSVSAAAAAATAYDDEHDSSDTTLASETRQIRTTLSNFMLATGISAHHVKAISAFSNMHEDICNGAEDLRASIIVMPFHKQQMVDGLMETVNEGHRSVNEKVLRHARCAVGILVDRGLGLIGQSHAEPGPVYQVGVLFFGGPDDREALAYASRMVYHPGVSLTVIRFIPCDEGEYANAFERQAANDNKVLTRLREHEEERVADDSYVASFYKRYITGGSVSYLEKYVANCVETVSAVEQLQYAYNLLVVGKGRSEGTPLTAGMADWVEHPELGHIGDLLASTDFGYSGSVLVVQQCKEDHDNADDDFA